MKDGRLAMLSVLLIFLSCFFPRQAVAYIGPGLGLSAIGAFLAVLAGAIVAVFGLVWYPIRKLMRKRKKLE